MQCGTRTIFKYNEPLSISNSSKKWWNMSFWQYWGQRYSISYWSAALTIEFVCLTRAQLYSQWHKQKYFKYFSMFPVILILSLFYFCTKSKINDLYAKNEFISSLTDLKYPLEVTLYKNILSSLHSPYRIQSKFSKFKIPVIRCVDKSKCRKCQIKETNKAFFVQRIYSEFNWQVCYDQNGGRKNFHRCTSTPCPNIAIGMVQVATRTHCICSAFIRIVDGIDLKLPSFVDSYRISHHKKNGFEFDTKTISNVHFPAMCIPVFTCCHRLVILKVIKSPVSIFYQNPFFICQKSVSNCHIIRFWWKSSQISRRRDSKFLVDKLCPRRLQMKRYKYSRFFSLFLQLFFMTEEEVHVVSSRNNKQKQNVKKQILHRTTLRGESGKKSIQRLVNNGFWWMKICTFSILKRCDVRDRKARQIVRMVVILIPKLDVSSVPSAFVLYSFNGRSR